jgi:signal transduction histidine kinase
MSETKNRDRSASKPAIMGLNIPTEIVPMAKEVIPRALVMRDFWKKILVPLRGGGIRRRLMAWGLSLFGIALLVVVVAGYFYMARQIRQDAAALQSELASVTGERVRNFVRRKIERFSDNAAALSLYSLGSKEQRLLLGLLVKNDSSFTEASIINSQGMEIVKVSDRKVYFPSDLTDQSKSTKLIKALKGEDYISPVYTSTQAQPFVTLAIPFWGAAQSIVGGVSVEADLSFLWEVIGKIHFATAGYAYLVDEHGNLIAYSDATLVLKRPDLRQVTGVQKFLRNPARSDPTPAQEGRGLLDKPVLTTYAPVPELGWAVILEEPIDAALANVETLKRSALVFLAIGLFVGAAVIAWVSGRMTGPIRDLHEGAKIIGSGNLDYRVNIETGDEIEWLGEEFNKMAGQLKVFYATLEQKVKDKTHELEKTNSELEQANRSLVNASNAKDEFLNVMSHELRTPLNVISGYAQILKDGVLGRIQPEQDHGLRTILVQSQELLRMINEVLQVGSLESGNVSVKFADINLQDFFADIRSTYEVLPKKAIPLYWNIPDKLPIVNTDGEKLKHILQNLITNAIKFTEEGSVTISARYLSQAIEFKVKDTGIGMPNETLPSIFQMFRQLDSSGTRSYGGAGVGLYVVKKFVELLNGKIEVESVLDKGSTFTVIIPIHASAEILPATDGDLRVRSTG